MRRMAVFILMCAAGAALAQNKVEDFPEPPPPPPMPEADEPAVRIPVPAQALPFYLGLMAHLARHGIPAPAPIADLADQYLGRLNGKPAALVTCLAGRSLERPGAAECAELGALLARMHLAGRSYSAYVENPRGPKWWRLAASE